MKKIITLCLFTLSISISAFSIPRVSASSGLWTTATTWSPAGIPTTADDLTILAGHNITISATANCRHLVVNGSFQFLANVFIQCIGNYTLSSSGEEKGTGQIQFGTGGTLLTVTGTTVGTARYIFNSNRTISSSSVISKLSSTTQVAANRTVTNLGTYSMGGSLLTATSTWLNGAGSTLTLTVNGFTSAAGLFNPSAANNTVIINYGNGNVPKPMAGSSYSNLIISGGSGTKALTQNLICTKNLTINAGATLNSANFDISVGGNWVKNGSFSASANHPVTFNGSSAQTLSGSGTTTFEQLTINNSSGGVSITSGIYVLNDVLTMSQGNFNTNGNSFTLISTATRTARIAPVVSGSSMSGNFIINRFITARDTTWTDLSSPVQGSTFVDWDDELPAISYTYNPPFQQPSAFTWNEPSNDFVPVTSSSDPLTTGKGFEVYLSNDFFYSSIPNLTLNSIGVPNQGNQNLTSLISFTSAYPTGSSNLVGNPFASSISWNSVLAASTNLDPTIDMFDYTAGSYTNFGAGTVIGSSQGFWVYTLNASATLNVNESAKTTATNSSLRTTEVEPYFTLKLSGNDARNTFSHTMKVAASTDATDGFDAGKDHWFRKSPMMAAPSIYTTIDGNKSVIDVFNANNTSYDMPVSAVAGISGYYKIEAKGFDFLNEFTCVKLEDKLLNQTIDLTATPVYSFKLNAGDDANRFVIHFSKSGNCKSLISTASIVKPVNEVEILPTIQGNIINFNFAEITSASVSVINMIGQTIVDAINVEASNQTVNVTLPEGYKGMYLVKVESSKGTIIKKFVK